jgi:hypothetical protein
MTDVHESTPQKILLILSSRFGAVPADVAAALQVIKEKDQRRMEALVWRACTCPSLDAFRRQISV